MDIHKFVSSLNDEEIAQLEVILLRNKEFITIEKWIQTNNLNISRRLSNCLKVYEWEFQCKYINHVMPHKLFKIRNAGEKVVNEFKEIMKIN